MQPHPLRQHLGFLGFLRQPAFLVLYAAALLAWFGYAQKFVPAPLLRYPIGLVYFLAPGAALAAWIVRTSRGRLRFDWKWAFLSAVTALLLWEGVAKGAAWVVTQTTGTPYDEAFPMQRNEKHVVRNDFYRADITGTKCIYRLQGKVLNSTLPQHLCLKGAEYAQLGEGLREVRLVGRIGVLGRTVDGYVLPAVTPRRVR